MTPDSFGRYTERMSARPDPAILEQARLHLGTGRVWAPGTTTPYGVRAGYPSLPWDGAFVDCILHEAGLRGTPSLVNPHMAFAALAARGEVPRKPLPGDVVLTSFGFSGILESSDRFSAVVIAGDQVSPARPGSREVRRIIMTRQDIILYGRPRGFPEHTGREDVPSAAQIRAEPERFLRGALQSHPYTRNLGPISMASALYRWALICGARPADAEKRRYKDEYIMRLGLESGYFQKGLR